MTNYWLDNDHDYGSIGCVDDEVGDYDCVGDDVNLRDVISLITVLPSGALISNSGHVS